MPITLNDIRTEVRANLKSSLIAAARVDFWANLAQDQIWRELDPEYGKQTATLTTTTAIRAYRFEASPLRILSVVDQTNDLRLMQISETDVERFDPDLNDAGRPNYYSLYGIDYVNNQPTAGSFVTVTSSSAADITQTIRILGTVSGVEDTEQLTLAGVGAIVGATTFTALTRISKSATTTGRVTATTNAGAVTNVVIPPRRLYIEYQPIRFWPVPNGTFTILVRYIRNPIPMRNVDDFPDLPEAWHSVLLELTMAYGHDFLYEFPQAERRRLLVQKQIGDLTASQSHKRDYAPVIGKRIYIPGIGRLPPDYPVG